VIEDYATAFLAAMISDQRRSAHPTLAAWAKATRLNPTSGLAAHKAHPRVVEARERLKRHGAAAAANLQRLLSSDDHGGGPGGRDRPSGSISR
jgi:hypothetical protein